MASPTPLPKPSNNTLHQSPTTTRTIRYLDTASAYDLWSTIYDTDGNFLQALDSLEMETLLPTAISLLTADNPAAAIRAVDLGCGTGRNTIKLLEREEVTGVVAVDLSVKMLEVARGRCGEVLEGWRPGRGQGQGQGATGAGAGAGAGDGDSGTSTNRNQNQIDLTFSTYDMTATPTPPAILTSPQPNLIISTLVLEHIPLPIFFRTISQILAPGGLLLLTNMHSEMGGISQAGFVDPETGDKIRPTSYAHEIGDVVGEAERWGFESVDGVREVRMERGMVEVLGGRSEKWVGVRVWFGGVWRRRKEEVVERNGS